MAIRTSGEMKYTVYAAYSAAAYSGGVVRILREGFRVVLRIAYCVLRIAYRACGTHIGPVGHTAYCVLRMCIAYRGCGSGCALRIAYAYCVSGLRNLRIFSTYVRT